MLKIFRSIFSKNSSEAINPSVQQEDPAPGEVAVDGLLPFSIEQHLTTHNGLPLLDWDAVHSWLDEARSDEQQGNAWSACERAWLLHFRDALGTGYYLAESETALLLSSLEPNVSRATLDYIGRTLTRVTKVLDGIAQVPPWGRDVLIVFDNEDGYYNYVSHYYPQEGGEFALSGGMHISAGCSHYVTVKNDLRSVEPVIAHEMTHGCLSHLPLPLWLNEGLAVNTERRLAGSAPAVYTPQEMREKHLAFWGADEVQQFWSGESFHRPDDGNLLSYDLARILVEQMSKDWEPFKQFVLNADWRDGGAHSARQHLGVELGEVISSMLEKPDADSWSPDPNAWQGQPA